MVRKFGSGEMKEFRGPEFKLENLTANLSDSDKEAVEELLTQYREEEKSFHDSVEKATESIKEEWEAKKTSIKEKIVAIIGESEEVESIFNRGEGRELRGGMGMGGFENGKQGMKEMREKNGFVEGEGQNPAFGSGEIPNFMNGERPELSEMNGERPQFGPRGEIKNQTSQGEQESK